MFQRAHRNLPVVLGIVEKAMATYICPNCGHVEHIFGHGRPRATSRKGRRALPSAR